MPQFHFRFGEGKAGSTTRIHAVGFNGIVAITWDAGVLMTNARSNAGEPCDVILRRLKRTVREEKLNVVRDSARHYFTGPTTQGESSFRSFAQEVWKSAIRVQKRLDSTVFMQGHFQELDHSSAFDIGYYRFSASREFKTKHSTHGLRDAINLNQSLRGDYTDVFKGVVDYRVDSRMSKTTRGSGGTLISLPVQRPLRMSG
jgi:ribosomal protein S21